ncbi:hypothetical protein ACIHAA_04205 [Streptomyces sp. NPDC052040]|uniref:hypothetical protein n=1 Tax=Streptomyces sp. NPDC052040 TaxID=3365682 RepID=UPI0037D227E2
MHMNSRIWTAGLALGAVVSLGMATPAEAASTMGEAPTGTTVSPAGHQFAAASAGTVTFDAGPVTVTCIRSATVPTSDSSNLIPQRPDNTNAHGPVTVNISAPEFDLCTTNAPGLKATISTNDDLGPWKVALQHGIRSTAHLIIPADGFVLKTSGLLSCTVTAAPGAAAEAEATWVNGAPSTLRLNGATVPVEIAGGFFCPTAITTATITATYQIADSTDPTQRITVSQATR